MNLPSSVELTRCRSERRERATIESLHREAAKQEIDLAWWNDLKNLLREPDEEPDSHWKWRDIVSAHQNKPYFQAKCLRSANGDIEAAVLLRVDALSALDDGDHAVFVDRLAAAPRNRDKLVKLPVFRGGGSGLLTYAIALSYSLGFSGRVNLFPVANENFYIKKGFVPTSVTDGLDTLHELPASEALSLLRTRGLIDD